MAKTRKPTESFSAYLLRGDALIVANTITTPKRLAYLVKEVELNPEVMRTWFKQAITPLVGETAAKTLDSMIRGEKGTGEQFLRHAIEFRKKHFR